MKQLCCMVLVLSALGSTTCRADEALPEFPKDLALRLKLLDNHSIIQTNVGDFAPLIAALSSKDTAIAHAAQHELLTYGPLVVPGLRKVANDKTDPLAAKRATACLSTIENNDQTLIISTLEWLSTQTDPIVVPTLIKFLPFSHTSEMQVVLLNTLTALAYQKDLPNQTLIESLKSDNPQVRAFAAEALFRSTSSPTQATLVQLISDPNPFVRMRISLKFATINYAPAVRELIELLKTADYESNLILLEALRNIAGSTAPRGITDANPTGHAQWTGWWEKYDAENLVKAFRDRTLLPTELPVATQLIDQLGSPDFRVREMASKKLLEMGGKVLNLLLQAQDDDDAERATRAKDCFQSIEQRPNLKVPDGIARLLAIRNPPEAIGVMRDYLPFLETHDTLVGEIEQSMTSIALRTRQIPGELLQGLRHENELVRLVTMRTLIKSHSKESLPETKKLLTDANLLVRQATAIELVRVGYRPALQTLVEMLELLPPSDSWPSLDMLQQLADTNAPKVVLNDDLPTRKQARTAWDAWLQENRETIDLAQLQRENFNYLGFTLVCEVGSNSVGRVVELDRDGKVRWEIGEIRYPVDAVVLPGNRVLVAEWDGNRVREFDFAGKEVWAASLPSRPTNVQRLPNGNTFVSATDGFIEVNREGKILTHHKISANLTAGYKAPDGQIICLRNDGKVVRYSADFKELFAFDSKRDTSWTSGIDLLRNGNILVSQPSPQMKVVEFSRTGEVVRTWNTPNVTGATALQTGGILAASHSQKKLIEYDINGKAIWTYESKMNIFRARRR
ncbi:MAG: HEAT repeat domain-containing protein [Zavarzinella sp.]